MADSDNNNLIKCKYNGGHLTEACNFTYSGLHGIFPICRECKRIARNKNRNKHREAYNEHHKLYQRELRERKRKAISLKHNESAIKT